MKKNNTFMRIRLPEELNERCLKEAEILNISLSSFVRIAISGYLESLDFKKDQIKPEMVKEF